MCPLPFVWSKHRKADISTSTNKTNFFQFFISLYLASQPDRIFKILGVRQSNFLRFRVGYAKKGSDLGKKTRNMDVCIYAITDTRKFRLPYTARHFEIRILVTGRTGGNKVSQIQISSARASIKLNTFAVWMKFRHLFVAQFDPVPSRFRFHRCTTHGLLISFLAVGYQLHANFCMF